MSPTDSGVDPPGHRHGRSRRMSAATKPGATVSIRSLAAFDDVVSALRQFVDYYDQIGMPDDITPDMEIDDDWFDGDEVFNVYYGRIALAAAANGTEMTG